MKCEDMQKILIADVDVINVIFGDMTEREKRIAELSALTACSTTMRLLGQMRKDAGV